MPLTIHSPKVESQIQQEAAQQGLTAEEYARRLLERHFQEEQAAVSTQAAPFHEAASPKEWGHALDAWVETHPSRQPLPEAAFARAGFYPNPA